MKEIIDITFLKEDKLYCVATRYYSGWEVKLQTGESDFVIFFVFVLNVRAFFCFTLFSLILVSLSCSLQHPATLS